MENISNNVDMTLGGYNYNELIDRLNNGSELNQEELEEIMWCTLFKSFDGFDEANKKDKNNHPVRIVLLSLAGNILGEKTKFLSYALDYRKQAYGFRKDNYNEILEGFNITLFNVCRENIEILVEQFDTASSYSANYQKLSSEIEEGLDDGLDSFKTFVGVRTMIEMDKEKDKIFSLRKKYKKM